MTNKLLDNLINSLFTDVKRYNSNIDECVSITLSVIYLLFSKKKDLFLSISIKDESSLFEYEKAHDYIFDFLYNELYINYVNEELIYYLVHNLKNFSKIIDFTKSDIRNSIEHLFKEKVFEFGPSARITNKTTQNLIVEIAKKINPQGPFIDLAVGFGSILSNFNSGEIWGNDINPKMICIARAYLYFCFDDIEYESLINDIRLKDSIDTLDVSKYKKGIFIFDPPMGDIRQVPEEWYNNIKFNEILKVKKQKVKLPSEVLFLLSFLLNSQKEDYFIGLFPESILTRNNKEYSNLKQYLLPNSLLAVIKVPTRHLLLIGKNSENLYEKYPKIPVLNISSELNSKQLDFITDSIVNQNHDYEKFYNILPDESGSVYRQIGIENYNKDFSQIFAYKIYDRTEASISNELQIPQIISYEEKIRTNPKEIFELIKENENKIQTAFNFINNIMNEFDSDDFIEEKEKPQWFEDSKTELESALKYFWAKRFDKYYFEALQMAEFEYKDVYNEQILGYLKCINKFKRLSTGDKENVINIHFKKEDEAQNLETNQFFNILKPENFDKTISDLLKMTDATVQDVYKNHCKYCIADLPEEETYMIHKKYQKKDLIRTFAVLERLGLVRKRILDETDIKSTVSLYEEYRTYIPDINTKGDKKYVY